MSNADLLRNLTQVKNTEHFVPIRESATAVIPKWEPYGDSRISTD